MNGARPALPEGCVEACRGCSHRSLSREESLAQKQAWLGKALAPWRERIAPVVSAAEERRWSYRNKICLRAEWGGERWRFGLLVRKPGDTFDYELVEIPDCPIHSENARDVLKHLAGALPGPDRLPLAFVSLAGSLLTLVVKSRVAPDTRMFEGLDLSRWGVKGIFLNLNPSAGQRVFSNRGWIAVSGAQRGVFPAFGRSFAHGPESFQQLLPELYAEALEATRDFLSPMESDLVLDLCSGIGVSARMWKDCGASVAGVELGGDAVACSEDNAGPGLVLRGRASERIPQLQEIASRHPSRLMFANPPRLGLESEVVSWIAGECRPRKLAYLSCSAGTLARDLAILTASGYGVRKIIPYDFFPQTHHVESLALLELDDPAPRLRGADDPRGAPGRHG